MSGIAIPRVCLIVETYAPRTTPAEREAGSIAESLAAAGGRPTVLTLHLNPELPALETIRGVTVHRLSPRGNRWSFLVPAFRWLVANQDRYDLVYVAPFRTLGLAPLIARRRTGKPVVLRARHEGELSGQFFDEGLSRWNLTHHSPGIRLVDSLRRKTLLGADHFVAATKLVRGEFMACGVPPDRCSLIPTPVDLADYCPASPEERSALRRELGVAEDAFVACYAGPLRRTMGVITALEGWRRVRPDGQSVLLVAGRGGKHEDYRASEVAARCADPTLPNPARYVGDVPDVASILRASDVQVMPCQARNSSFFDWVALAMACGIPVVTTTVSGLADLVRPDVNALTVVPGDADGTAAAIERLRADPALGARLGAQGALDVAERGSDLVAQTYKELFFDLVGTEARERDRAPRVRKVALPPSAEVVTVHSSAVASRSRMTGQA